MPSRAPRIEFIGKSGVHWVAFFCTCLQKCGDFFIESGPPVFGVDWFCLVFWVDWYCLVCGVDWYCLVYGGSWGSPPANTFGPSSKKLVRFCRTRYSTSTSQSLSINHGSRTFQDFQRRHRSPKRLGFVSTNGRRAACPTRAVYPVPIWVYPSVRRDQGFLRAALRPDEPLC